MNKYLSQRQAKGALRGETVGRARKATSTDQNRMSRTSRKRKGQDRQTGMRMRVCVHACVPVRLRVRVCVLGELREEQLANRGKNHAAPFNFRVKKAPGRETDCWLSLQHPQLLWLSFPPCHSSLVCRTGFIQQ